MSTPFETGETPNDKEKKNELSQIKEEPKRKKKHKKSSSE